MSECFNAFHLLKKYVESHIIGQSKLVNRLLIAILADGHMLVEGAPGLAKTKAIHSLSKAIEGDFQRIQFTPDLLPADLTGSEVYRPQEGTFEFQKGPLFHNLVLADEINRAPAKVQSALLEAMAERQITVGHTSYPLSDLFLVMATQNPIEQEGTYPLPEAQLDRFLLQVNITYPDVDSELKILRLNREELAKPDIDIPEKLTQEILFQARKEVLNLHISEPLERYLVELVMATRNPERYSDELQSQIRYGVSPRATIALDRCARAHAWLSGKDFVSPDDIQAILPDVFRHRVLISFEAEAEGITADDVIQELVNKVPVP
ncbi:MoxR family ATPase [Francisellaceae bacterium]|nr:MoxR family ATPase [Francisellaceae bacterium]